MKTIIVPVDFSSTSINTLNYAVDFAAALKADISIIHIYNFPVSFGEMAISPDMIKGELEVKWKALEKMKTNLLAKNEKINVHIALKEGDFINELNSYCNALQPYAVIMGASNKDGLEKFLLGSATKAAVKHIKYPVVIVPPGYLYKHIFKVGLACDMDNVENSLPVDEIKRLVTGFNAVLHILHVDRKNLKENNAGNLVDEIAFLQSAFADLNPEFHFAKNSNIDKAVKDFVEENNLAVLIVVPKNHSFPENAFHKSQSKQLLADASIPIISIHE
jgi:nucleotide-binding universal stress UspA family protein